MTMMMVAVGSEVITVMQITDDTDDSLSIDITQK